MHWICSAEEEIISIRIVTQIVLGGRRTLKAFAAELGAAVDHAVNELC